MEAVPRVVLGLESPALAQEVMHFLDRTGCARVVGTASDGAELARVLHEQRPHAVIGNPHLLRGAGAMNGSELLALDIAESVHALREALELGARGFFVWPAEREELSRAAAQIATPSDPPRTKAARVVAVYGARGGAGATFVATHLAAAMAREEEEVALVDMDGEFGDVAPALGVPFDSEFRTVEDLAPVAGEIGEQHLEGVLWPHPAGFRVLLAPRSAPKGTEGLGSLYRGALEALLGAVDILLLHLPRRLDEAALSGLELADSVLVVLTLDVMGFRNARRAVERFAELGLAERCEFIVNRARRAEISPGDVERVFGCPVLAVIPVDRAVPAAQDRGVLVPLKGRTGRAIQRLAVGIRAPSAQGEEAR